MVMSKILFALLPRLNFHGFNMKIFQKKIDKTKKLEYIDVVPETTDDTYTLYNIIDTDDIVEATTSRKVEIRPNVHTRIMMKLCIKTETMHADLENGFLCIKGKVQKSNEHVSAGQYHTIEIGLSQKLRVFKTEYTILLKQSLNKKVDVLLFLIVRPKEIVFYELSDNFASIKSRVQYKGKKFTTLVSSCKLEKYKLVALLGENNINDLHKAIFAIKENKIYEKKAILVKYSDLEQTPHKIVNTVINDSQYMNLFNGVQFVKELKELAVFLDMHINTELTCIGYKEVSEALEMGALKKFFVTNTKLKSFEIEQKRAIEELCKMIENYKIPIYIIPAKHENGERLDSMGGMAGVLKYNYKQE